jgi:membrane-bound serine protease (ClpP class)
MQASRQTDLMAVGLLFFVTAVFGGFESSVYGANEMLGQFVTVTSPVDDVMSSRVTNVALELQKRAEREDREAVLVLELTPGSSRFGQVRDLAQFLSSTRLSRVRTVAWIPGNVLGHNAILALACHDIVMHPDAEIGDIGRGEPMDPDEQQFVIGLVNKQHNVMLSPALAMGMMDRDTAVLKVDIEGSNGNESKVVTRAELDSLSKTGIAIRNVYSIKEPGVVGRFSGRHASKGHFLVTQTRESRPQVAELYQLEPESMREAVANGEKPRVALIEVHDMIEPVLEAFLERQIDRAVANGVNTIIFEIDSPGGYLVTSENLAFKIAALEEDNVRSVAYIRKEAISGAAIIAMGCDEIYMHADASIGDAGPIELRKGGQFERAPEKILSPLRVTLGKLAERKGRPSALLMAMADRNMQVFEVTHRENGRVTYMNNHQIQDSNGEWIKGPMVPESGKDLLLTFDGQRAHEVGLAKAPVDGFDMLKDRLGIAPEVQLIPQGRTWIDTMVFVLNTGGAMFLLCVVGVICIYLELHFTTGLLGIVSALCFSLFFWSRFLGGTAGWLEIVLFALGLVFIALEIFVIPGFGVFGVSGGLLVFASLIMASQTFGNLETNRDLTSMSRSVGTLGASIVAVIAVAAALNRFLPNIPILNQMILSPPGTDDGEDSPRLRPEYTLASGGASALTHDPALVGTSGITTSMLRPAGKARIGDQYLDVVSNGPFIETGQDVEVIEVVGNRVVVKTV